MVIIRENLFAAKETADVIGVQPTKSTQAMQPAWEKVAKHFLYDPERTLLTIIAYANRMKPMPDEEIEQRVRIQTGKP